MPKALKLLAAENEDVEILSAAIEGLITSPGEMSYLKSKRAFAIMGSRFKWEDAAGNPENSKSWYRIRSGLYIGDVMAVKSSGISQENPTEVLELLNLSTQVGEDLETKIVLNFAGGGTIHLKTECINLSLTDTGEAWKTSVKPEHNDTSSPDQKN